MIRFANKRINNRNMGKFRYFLLISLVISHSFFFSQDFMKTLISLPTKQGLWGIENVARIVSNTMALTLTKFNFASFKRKYNYSSAQRER